MQPLRIEFTLAGPTGRPARPIHLDSLIAHQLVQRDLPPNVEIAAIRDAINKLPLERLDIGGDWVWAASTLAFAWDTPPQQHLATRSFRGPAIAEVQLAGLFSNRKSSAPVDTTRGIFKTALYTHETQWARRAVAFCIGDKAEITDLLGRIEHIGARRRLGGGRVVSVDIVEDEAAHELAKRRYLPAAASEGRMVEGAYRLPLFDRAHQTIVRDNSLTL